MVLPNSFVVFQKVLRNVMFSFLFFFSNFFFIVIILQDKNSFSRLVTFFKILF